ncbi:MAG: hypothetical protein ICV60_16280 [Pyrinomonadaceae bacterium]|nr:hypothetical protein [Pyrinomonadaceae bacterium]
MNYLISIATLLLILAPQNQKLPNEFYQIPEDVRAKATVVITGTYAQGRGPCILRPDGIRMWALESWFNITKVYQGKAGGKSISINNAMLPKSEYVRAKLETGRDYLVLLRPSAESMKIIKKGEYVPVWDALSDEEIIAIVELN